MSAIFLTTIERVARELPGAFGVCAVRLDTNERLASNDERVFPAASVIKIAVALEVLCAIEEGALDASSQLELRASDKVIGSGVLAALEPGLRLSILDLLYLSTAISDNTAANLLIGRVGTTAVNARLAKLGLTTTRLTGRIFVEGENGERSPSTAAELVTLLRRVHDRDGLPPRACEKLVALLERTQTASTIGRGLPDERFPGISRTTPPELVLAYKTGSIEGVVAEAAIVRAPRATYAIAVMSEGSGDLRPNHDNVARVHLGAVSRAVYDTFTGP
ncbi:MAG: beta-lactamase [Labilithrix sp.]|nr:beta-lactamase [Labilithrix sp.]